MNKTAYEKNYNKTLKYENTQKETRDYINYFKKNYLEYLPRKKNIRILDIGCGSGLFLEFLLSQGYKNALGIDLSQDNIEICKKKKLNVVKEDAFVFLKKNQKFDLIVMNDIIEHIPKNEIADLLKLIKSCLNSDGSLIVKTLNMSNPISLDTLYCDFTHEVGFTEKSMEQVMLLGGFENIVVKNLIIYPNIWFLDFLFPIIYKFLFLKFKLVFTFYGKKDNKVFSKHLLCIVKK